MTDNRIDEDAPRHGKGQNKKRIIGFIIIGVIAFGIFVPVFPLPGGTYTFCDYRAGYCRTITNYGSLTEILFCLGTEADTAGHIWWVWGCLSFPELEAGNVRMVRSLRPATFRDASGAFWHYPNHLSVHSELAPLTSKLDPICISRELNPISWNGPAWSIRGTVCVHFLMFKLAGLNSR